MSKPKIVIGMASRGYDVCPAITVFVNNTIKKHDAEFIYRICGFNAIPAQEGIFWGALEAKADYLLIVDSDVTPPDNVIELLLNCNKDIVVAPVWHYNVMNGHIFVDAVKELNQQNVEIKDNGVEEIITASFGCVLISKNVLNKFLEKKENFVYWSSMLPKDAFNCSSDTIFYLKARHLGYPAYVCWDAQGSEHYTRIHLSNRVLGNFLSDSTKEVKK